MRSIAAVCFLLLGITLSAQVSIKGIIRDSSSKLPVPYSLILLSSHKAGVIANDKGEFELTIPDSLKNGYLEISNIGFDTTVISSDLVLKTNKKEFFINRKPVVLPEVSISSFEQKLCKEKWGAKNKHSRGNVFFKYGCEIAIFIPNTSTSNGIISGLKFFINNEGYPATHFRARLYQVNPKDSTPGELLIDQDLILTAKKGNEWVEMDISKFNIAIPKEGFFVSMEWLPDSQNHQFTIDIKKSDREIKYEGQVLGLTPELKSKNTWIKSFLGDWYHMNASDYNAMIGADVLINCK